MPPIGWQDLLAPLESGVSAHRWDHGGAVSLVALLHAAQGGQQAPESERRRALEELLTELHPRVTRYATARVSRALEAAGLVDDVAQETLFIVVRKLAQCRATTDEQLVAWVLTIARRTAIGLLRRQASRLMVQSLSKAYEQGMAAAAWRAWLEEVEDELTPEDRHLACLLVDEYEQLAPDTMELLFVHLVEGRSWPEVAEQFGSTSTAVKRRCQRALRRLRNRLLRAVSRLPAGEQQLLLARLKGNSRR